MNLKTYNGVVLKRTPLREADEVVTLWSWEEGKVRLLVRGLRKSSSKLKAAGVPLAWVELGVVASEYLPIVTSARTVKSNQKITCNLEYLAMVFNIFEIVLRTTPDREPNVAISMLLRQALDFLNDQEHAGLDFILTFRLKFLTALGYEFQFSPCRQCGQALNSKLALFWSDIFMGPICGSCSRFDPRAKKLDLPTVLHLVSLGKTSGFSAGSNNQELNVKGEKLLSEVFQALTERDFRSKIFLSTQMQH